jgi:hypothetical protein
MRMPQPVILGVAMLAGSALAGCGSGDTAAVLAPSAAHGTGAVTKAQAVAYAQAVNLRAADLPRMNTSSPEHEGKAPTRLELALARCDGEQDPLQRVLNRVSPTFTSPTEGEGEHEEIHSSVEVLPTATIAAKHNAAQISPRGLGCIRRFFPAAFAKSDTRRLRYGPVTLHHLPDPLPGTPGSFAVRITTSVLGVPSQIAATPPHVYIDILGFLAGASEINLTATGFPEPVAEEAEQHLLTTLYNRAHASRL